MGKKETLNVLKRQALYLQGKSHGNIKDFSEDEYTTQRIKYTIIDGLRVYLTIKYTKASDINKDESKGLYLFFCFDDADLVKGTVKDIKFKRNTTHHHEWVERGNLVYDPEFMEIFDKDLYYTLFQPTDIIRLNKYTYNVDGKSTLTFEDIRETTIASLRRGGEHRHCLADIDCSLLSALETSDDQEFKAELNEYLEEVEYDQKEVNSLKIKFFDKVLTEHHLHF